jgi:hypothetical protein
MLSDFVLGLAFSTTLTVLFVLYSVLLLVLVRNFTELTSASSRCSALKRVCVCLAQPFTDARSGLDDYFPNVYFGIAAPALLIATLISGSAAAVGVSLLAYY